MRASVFVGRVGVLALALGIGSGVAIGGVGAAWAAPANSDSAGGADSVGDATSTRSNSRQPSARQRGGRSTRVAEKPAAAGLAEGGNSGLDEVSPGAAPSRAGRASAGLPPQGVISGTEDAADVATVFPTPSASMQGLSDERMVLPPAVNSLATLTVPTAAEAPPASPVLTAPEAELPASAVVPPVMVPTPQRSVAAAGAVEAVLATLSGAGPAAPLESAVSWVMLAAARRELGSPAAAQSTPAAAVPTEPLIDTEVAPSRTATRSAVAAPAAAAGAVQAIDPIAAATAVDPITAFVEQIQAFVTGVVTAITQVVNQVVQAVTQAVTAIVNIFVPVPANSAPFAETPTVGTPDAGTGVVTGKVSASDPDGDALTYSAPASTAKGSVVIDGATGEFTYTPTDAARHGAAALDATSADLADSFTVTVADGYGGSATAVVGVVISPANRAPVVGTPTVGSPNESTGVVVGTVIASDSDGDPLTFIGSTTTAKGSVVVDADGGFTYTPTAAARHQAASEEAVAADLVDSFTVTATDGYGGSATAVVGVVISPANRAPVVGTPTVGSPNESTGVVVGTVIASDSDGDPLTFIGSTTTAKGSVVVDADGGFTYTPTAAARHQAASEEAVAADLVDSFTVTVADGYGGSVEVPVVVAVSPLAAAPNNSAPVVEISTVGAPDATSGVVIGQIDASDPDGDVLVYAAPASTAKGAVVIDSATGEFTYTPTVAARHAAAGLNATNAGRSDSFTVTVADGYGGTATALVSVVIAPANDAPVAGIPVVGTPDVVTGVVVGSVSASDSDGDALIFSGSTTTAKGRVVVDADGRFTYTPTAAARHDAASDGAVAADLADSFTVTVSDGHGGSVEVPVAVSVSPSNTAPQSLASFVGDPDESTGVVTGSVSASDADGDSLTYSGPIGTAKGSVVVAADGGFTYTPTAAARHDAAREGVGAADLADSFTVTVADGHGGAATAVVSVVIAPANDAPVAGSPVVGTPDVVTGVVFGSVSASDSDGDALTFSGSTTTAKGSVVVDADGGFTYTPTPAALATAGGVNATDADRTDVFTVNITDNFGGFAAVAVSVPIGTNANPGVTVAINSGYSPDYPSYVDEGDGGTTVVPVRVELSRASDVEVTVDYVVSSRYLAVAGEDFLAETGSVVFAPGQMQAEIPVTIYGDTDYEPDEVVRVELTGVTNAALVLEGAEESRSRFGSVSIINDDSAPGVTVAINSGYSPDYPSYVDEGDGGTTVVPVRVELSRASDVEVTVDYVVSSRYLAVAGEDFLAETGSVVFAPGQMQAEIPVTIYGDTDYEPDEVVRVELTGVTNAALVLEGAEESRSRFGSVSIINDDSVGGNAAPVAGSPTVGVPNVSSGVVIGSVNATDPDGDVLLFSGSTATAKGSVVVDADGAFTYTPTATARHDAAREGAGAADLADSFTVTVTDGNGGAATAVVSVVISPANDTPVAGPPVVSSPDTETGVVSGTVSATDGDGDSLIFSGSAITAKGSVVVNADGEFTYTPTPEARRAAYLPNATGDDLHDTFSVTLTDGHGGSAVVTSAVAIGPAVTYYVTKDVKRDPVTGVIALRTIFPESTQQPGTELPGYLNWLAVTPNVGATHLFPAEVASWDNLFLVGMDEVSDPYSSQVAMPTGAVLRNPQNGSVAIRTIFGEAEPALANMAWLIATPSQGALHVPSTSLEGWDILLVPGSTPAILGYTTADPESNGVVRGNINAVDPDGDVLTYSAPAATGKGYVVVDADLGAFVYAPTAAARQSAGQVQAGADGRFDTFTVTVSDGYFSSESEISVVVTPAPAPRAGDIRVQPGGAVRAMYAPNVTSWGDDWIGVDPSSGGMWLSDGELADWLDVASPTGAETAGFGPYQPGDVKVPPGSVAGSVTWFAVKSGPELTDMGYGWMVCNVSTACHGSSDDEVISSVSAVPIGQWADLRHPLEIELG